MTELEAAKETARVTGQAADERLALLRQQARSRDRRRNILLIIVALVTVANLALTQIRGQIASNRRAAATAQVARQTAAFHTQTTFALHCLENHVDADAGKPLSYPKLKCIGD